MTSTDTIRSDQDATEQTVWISFRTSTAEREELREHAHLARVSVSEMVRRRVLNLPPPKAAVPGLNARAYGDLGRVGNNLNQLAKQANESGQFGPTQLPQLVQVLTEFKRLVDQFRSELIGANQ